MDPSSLIFVALAVAWAVYLVPKALRHHDDAVRSRSVDRFSQSMRVLARREVVSRRNARLVVSPSRPASSPIVTSKITTTRVPNLADTPAARTAPAPAAPVAAPVARSTARAARRRRRVLGLILTSLVAVAALAAFGVIAWGYAAIPAGLLVAWLVACRLMVRQERGLGLHLRRPRAEHVEDDSVAAAPDDLVADEPASDIDPLEDTTSTPAIVDPSLWDPMPVTLPTYVSKPVATRRSVRTIDLDSTGVWTSGRTESDARLARDADEAARAARTAEDDARRATGS